MADTGKVDTSEPHVSHAQQQTSSLRNFPPQSVFIDLKSFVVLEEKTPSRHSPLAPSLFNPTNSSPPFFQIFDEAFLSVLGDNPSIVEIASNSNYAFAHEAPVYIPETDDLWFCSNNGGSLAKCNLNTNSEVGKISMAEVEMALQELSNNCGVVVNVPVKMFQIEALQMTNGGTGPYKGDILFVTSGRGHDHPPSIVRVKPRPPYQATVILDNLFARQFNSLNDVKIHPISGHILFTDPIYGYINGFRPSPALPNQVYSFDPNSGRVRVVADGFQRPNGIAITSDGRTAYITDTGIAGGEPTFPSTIYAFDVSPAPHTFTNRRVFAFADAGIPDGIQIDQQSNVYSACGDGIHVWNSEGTLIGKFFIGTESSNMAFAGDGRLVILAETRIFVAKIAAKPINLAYS